MLKTIKKALGMSGVGDDYIGSISTFAGSYAPEGYIDCDGRMLNIKDYQILYVVIGNKFGGDGVSTFALPDLRPFSEDDHTDMGKHRRVDWSEVKKPRQAICYMGVFPVKP